MSSPKFHFGCFNSNSLNGGFLFISKEQRDQSCMRAALFRCAQQHRTFNKAIKDSITRIRRPRKTTISSLSRNTHLMNNQPEGTHPTEPSTQLENSSTRRAQWWNRRQRPNPRKASNTEAPDNAIDALEEDTNTTIKNKKPPKLREPRPDHFLALQLSHHPDVSSALNNIQSSIASHSPHLKPSFIEPASAHLTLGVLSLPDELSKEAATAALRGAVGSAKLTSPCPITLQGLGHFRNEVLYLEVAEGDSRIVLDQLVAAVRGYFIDQNLLLQANRDFVPHVTIAKLSKMKPWGGGRKTYTRNWNRNRKKKENEVQGSHAMEVECDLMQGIITHEVGIINNKNNNNGDKIRVDIGDVEILPRVEDSGLAATSGAMDSTIVGLDEDITVAINSEPEEVNDVNMNPCGAKEKGSEEKLKIPPESYAEHAEVNTCVEVGELQLCAMEGRKPGKYYRIIARVSLVQDWEEHGGASIGAPMEEDI